MENLKIEGIKTIFEIKKNEEKNGIELYFETIPNYNEREILKNNGFRWHNIKKCWYKKIEGNAKKEQKENKKEIELKEIRKATPEEVAEIAKEKWGNSQRMQDFIIKSYDFYLLKDGYYIEVEKCSKLSLHRTMWYDDETEGPENNEANFISYNLRMSDPFDHIEAYLEEKERLQKESCATGAYDYKGMYIENYKEDTKEVYINFYYDKKGNVIRYLTEQEQEDYIKIKKDLKEQYIERLKKYYKRYSKHVHASGYWVNR